MMNCRQIVTCVGMIGCLVVLVGCSDADNEEAKARGEAKLQEAKVQQQATETERDELKEKVGALSQSIQTLKSELNAAAKLKDQLSDLKVESDSAIAELKNQMTGLLGERDSAMAKLTAAQATIDKMTSQLQEQVQKFTQLDEQNKQFQATIEDLKKKLGGEIKLPSFPNFK